MFDGDGKGEMSIKSTGVGASVAYGKDGIPVWIGTGEGVKENEGNGTLLIIFIGVGAIVTNGAKGKDGVPVLIGTVGTKVGKTVIGTSKGLPVEGLGVSVAMDVGGSDNILDG